MESLPLPALPADPAPPPPAPRPASEDRGFADTLRAAHADDAAPDHKPAAGGSAAATPHRVSRGVHHHKSRHHHDSARDATAATAASATAASAQAPTAPKPTAQHAADVATPGKADTIATAPVPANANGKTPAATNAIAGKDAAPQAASAPGLAAAVSDAGPDAKAAGPGNVGKTDATKITAGDDAGKPSKSKVSKDKPHGDTKTAPPTAAAAVPVATPAAADQAPARTEGDATAAKAAVAATDGKATSSAASAAQAAASAAGPKTDGKKTAVATGDADGSGNGSKSTTDDATQAAAPGDAQQAADDKRKAAVDSARKSDAAKDKKARASVSVGQQKPADNTPRAADHAANAPAAPRPADAATARADGPTHQAAGPDSSHNAPQNATAPGAGFIHDLRAQTQLSTQQAQATNANAAARLPTPPANQVAVQIGRALQQGQDHFTVELHPADLGRISVDLQLGSDQRVVAVIHADHHATLQLLQQDSHTLQRSLQDAGLRTDSGSLSFNLRGDGGGSQQSFAQFGGNARPIAVNMPATAAIAAEPAAQHVRPLHYGDSGIDIRV